MTAIAPEWDALPGAVMPFDWRAFADKHRIAFRELGGIGAVAGPAAFRLALFAASQIGWLLDDIVDPRWRETEMRGPLFILGHQRSGTTFLHRLLAGDETHARSLLFHEMILPASSVQNALARLAAWDRGRGGRLTDWFQSKQNEKFGPLDNIHRLRFDEVEEDEFVLWAIYASAMCVNDSPISTANENLDFLRHYESWPERQKIRALNWYKACVLKKVHRETKVAGQAVWGVSKNPAFSQKAPDLLKVFPDARMLYLLRNPMETIPSRLSLIRAIWRHRFPGFQDMTPQQVKTIVADSIRTYLYAERDLAALPDAGKLVIRYEDLTADPRKTVLSIYRHFKLPGPDESLAARLNELKKRRRRHESKHRSSLAEFHLTENGLREQLKTVFQHHEF